jgi:hypothetical protein
MRSEEGHIAVLHPEQFPVACQVSVVTLADATLVN